MESLLPKIAIQVNEKVYLKDPESSDLGKKILLTGIDMIEDLGFEDFTFRKLAKQISSTEASIYRYFESKHKLLLYITSWYWAWIEYQLVLETYSIYNSKEKLIKAIEVVTRIAKQDTNFGHINEILLNEIVINENSKSYLTKNVDIENKDGYFISYKRVVTRLSEIILVFNPNYKFALSLASTIVESSLHQQFIKIHFKSITNCNDTLTPTDYFTDVALKILSNGK